MCRGIYTVLVHHNTLNYLVSVADFNALNVYYQSCSYSFLHPIMNFDLSLSKMDTTFYHFFHSWNYLLIFLDA